MKKLLRSLLPLLSLSLIISCSKTKTIDASSSATVANANTYIDDLGRSVTVPSAKRVVTLIGSFADVWCIAGGKDSLVATADDTWTQFDLGLGEDVIKIGAIKAPSLEKILAAAPDLIIGSAKTSADVALKETFEELNIPVLYFNVSSFNDYLRMLEICTSITGNKKAYQTYGLSLQEEINKAISRQDGSNPTVLYVRASTSSVKIKNSSNTVLGEMLKDLGCINIADSNTNLLENLSMETILKEDPDFIFGILQSSNQEKSQSALEKALLDNPVWSSLTAVKEGRFIMLDPSLYNMKPNAKWGTSYTKLSKILYEEN